MVKQFGVAGAKKAKRSSTKIYARFIPFNQLGEKRKQQLEQFLKQNQQTLSPASYVMAFECDCYTDGLPASVIECKKTVYEFGINSISSNIVPGYMSRSGVFYVNRVELSKLFK